MTWTTTPPRVPGWYWWREHAGASIEPVQIERILGHLTVYRIGEAEENANQLAFYLGEWQGPIEPEE